MQVSDDGLIYGQVAMKVFVDNFAVLGIEYCLLDALSSVFVPEMVMQMEEGLINNIAAETEDSRTERTRLTKKLTSLEAGLDTLTLNRYRPARTPLCLGTYWPTTRES
jgi:hypothetical protein